jgi:uncharacterized protein
VEDAVNAVGVDVNTASRPLLARVSGVTDSLAGAIVAQRDANGAFSTRDQLKAVPRLGPKAFEQCAGFLRIRGGTDPLDASGVHPEAYPVVRRMLEKTHGDVATLIGNTKTLRGLNPAEFTDEAFGLPTVNDILKELEKPGRDPRPEFQTATFAEGVQTLGDLEPGMVLEGVVTNVAAFGAFVDIGVHQDGLVHVSAMSNNFVADPRDVAKSGDVVKVKVLSVDIPRNRISLTMRLQEDAEAGAAGSRSPRGDRQGSSRTSAADPGRAQSSPRPGDNRRAGGAGPRGDRRSGAPGNGAPDHGAPDHGAPNHGAASGRPGDQQGGGRPGGSGNDGRGGQGGHGPGQRGGAPGSGNDRRGNGSGTGNDRRGNGSGTGNDRQGAGSGTGSDRRGGGSGNSNDRRSGGGQGGDRRNTPAAPANGAMADALRRAGLLNDKNTQTGKQDRRSGRP